LELAGRSARDQDSSGAKWFYEMQIMKAIDQYHKWVEWSEEDQTYIGKCPDLITGIHGDDPVKVYEELCGVLEEVIGDFAESGDLALLKLKKKVRMAKKD